MGLAFVGQDGILRADWQSAHPCSWSLPPTEGAVPNADALTTNSSNSPPTEAPVPSVS
jgi:hypothetical protein